MVTLLRILSNRSVLGCLTWLASKTSCQKGQRLAVTALTRGTTRAITINLLGPTTTPQVKCLPIAIDEPSITECSRLVKSMRSSAK